MTILEEALALKPYMVELRNYFHSHPELALHESNTCTYIEEKLSEIALPFKRVAGTNVIAELDSGFPGKTLLLRADIDALPIQEENNVPYKSQNPGIMHACGHDGHTAYLLGAAKILSAHKKDLKGKVIFAFQAAEEIGSGAREIKSHYISGAWSRLSFCWRTDCIPAADCSFKAHFTCRRRFNWNRKLSFWHDLQHNSI